MACETKILTLKAKRTAKGLEVFMQSEHLEAFFKGLSAAGNGIDNNPNWIGITGNRINYSSLQDVPIILNSWGGPLIQNNGLGHNVPNCSMLRASGLGEGITFTMQGLFSEAIIEEWQRGLKKGVNEICRQYLSPKEIEFEIMIKDVIN